MRVPLLFVLSLFITSAAVAVDWSIDHVHLADKSENDFKRISEYFTGQENTGGRLIFRVNEDQRAGTYFILGLNQAAKRLAAGTTLKIAYFVSGEQDPRTHSFTVPETVDAGAEVLVGLTGSANIAENQNILAWKIELIDPQGQLLAERTSFLWELPEQQ